MYSSGHRQYHNLFDDYGKCTATVHVWEAKCEFGCAYFNNFVAQTLLDLGSKHNILHCHETSVYIKIISTWWDVVNVETPMKGLPKKPYQQPLTKRDTEARRLFWNNCPHGKKFLVTVGKSARKLSLHCGTRATGSLQQQIIVPELRLNYVLLGKFQTDFFEARFG